MKGFKFEPVRWMTWVVVVLAAVLGANETAQLLPDRWVAVVAFVLAVLLAILGTAVRSRTTALARPRDAAGTALVPLGMTTRATPTQAIRRPPYGGA